jgi:predicted regulator of Ras-like GTPase activity (Roadblock/LC7/MglB family)
MLPAMDAAQALADLTEISSQVVNVAILEDGEVLATTFEDAGEASRFAEGVARLVAEADRVGEARGLSALAQLEAATLEGSVFVVRRGSRLIAATTRPDPTVGLVFYDLKHCLGSVDAAAEAQPGGKPGGAPRRRRTKADASG